VFVSCLLHTEVTVVNPFLVRVTVTRSKGTVILRNPTGYCKRESLCVLVVRVQLQGAYSPSGPSGEHPGSVLVAVLLLVGCGQLIFQRLFKQSSILGCNCSSASQHNAQTQYRPALAGPAPRQHNQSQLSLS
jgi:hypothetical protein